MNHVPRTYAEWEHCITVECGIPLTAGYVAGRIPACVSGSRPRRLSDAPADAGRGVVEAGSNWLSAPPEMVPR
ncbi:hypothetical protein DPM13_14980 [Paracoccus mutanolyticus]|uniref:Uncharacterized protein n=1 Tax=Paracoccus mutanolyticus TaxID=1499308 RepID=A0ABM6WT66_9RHOB|nr:hypothetical protein DPM13_14980 [Paracoccus mutanolyticus]